MKFEELHLDGFGHFHQRTFTLSDRGLTVFYGPNEAGKSTLLAFIRTILFGFPRQNRNDHYPPLAGGRHGGRIRLTTDEGETYILERYVGTSGGPLTILDGGGSRLDSGQTLARLVGQSSSAVFSNVFAFGIDELQQVGLLDDASVSDAIYSAGQGVPGLSGFGRSLASRQEEIFRVRGSAQRIPTLAKAIGGIDDQLKVVVRNADRYGTLTTRRQDIDANLAALDPKRSHWTGQQAELRNLLDAWDDWLAFNDCSGQLESLPRYEQFPVDATPRLAAFEEVVGRVRADKEEAAKQLRLATEAAAVPVPDETLLEAAGQVEEIRRARTSFDGSVHDLPERLGELRELEAALSARLADLGRPWGETKLEAFDASLAARDQVSAWKGRLDNTGEALNQADLRLDQENRTLLDRQLETREAREQAPAEPPPLDATGLSAQQDALRSARGCFAEHERQWQNHQNLQGQLNALTSGASADGPAPTPPFLLILLIVGAIAMGTAGAFLGGPGLPMGVAGAVVLAVVAVFLWLRGRSGSTPQPVAVTSPLGRQTTEAEAATERAWQVLLDAAAPLELPAEPDAASLDTKEARLVEIRTQLAVWETAASKVEEASRRERSQEQRAADAVAAQKAAADAHQESQKQWRQWLADRQLDESLSPDGMVAFVGSVETARQVLAETRRMRSRVTAIEKDIGEFKEKVEPLASAHAIPLDTDNLAQLALAADALISRLDAAREAQSMRQRASEQQEAAQNLVEDWQRRQQTAQRELDEFIALGGTDDPEEFRRRAADHNARLELERQQQELKRSLERLSGPGEKFDAFRARLASTDQLRLNEESTLVTETLQGIEAQRSDLLEERGRIDSDLERLTGEEESSRLRVHRETLVEQLRDCAREWARLTLAQNLLDQTRQKFEAERQPRVVQHASDFFSRITDQRYRRLYVPMGERTVTVEDRDGSMKVPQQLSRGTREQLYLALRFGLVREFGEHAERLPVVVDEALVNFDPNRARLAAECFAQLADTNQVLVFTCHPAIADLFSDLANSDVIEVEEALDAGP